jgi:hypothetical protein
LRSGRYSVSEGEPFVAAGEVALDVLERELTGERLDVALHGRLRPVDRLAQPHQCRLAQLQRALARTARLQVRHVICGQVHPGEVLGTGRRADLLRNPEVRALLEPLDVLDGGDVGGGRGADPHRAEHGHLA